VIEIVRSGIGVGAGAGVEDWARSPDATRTIDAAALAVASVPVASVIVTHVCEAAGKAPTEIVPDTPPADGKATVWAWVLGYTHVLAEAAGKTIDRGGGVSVELPPHPAKKKPKTPSVKMTRAVRRYRTFTCVSHSGAQTREFRDGFSVPGRRGAGY
jgi:hypothetical protein